MWADGEGKEGQVAYGQTPITFCEGEHISSQNLRSIESMPNIAHGIAENGRSGCSQHVGKRRGQQTKQAPKSC